MCAGENEEQESKHRKKNGDIIFVRTESGAVDHEGKKAILVVVSYSVTLHRTGNTFRKSKIRTGSSKRSPGYSHTWYVHHWQGLWGWLDLLKNFVPGDDKDALLVHLTNSAKELDAIIINIADNTPENEI